jgi:hypothetical protein
MTKTDSVLSTPPTNTSPILKANPPLEARAESVDSFPLQPAIGQRERAKALSDLARLREEASAEIERLIAFLDASDQYVMTEIELDESESGIGDFDGALEQVGTQDWQQGALA